MRRRTIVVTGNCQAGMIASALELLFPDDHVQAYHAWDLATPDDRVGAATALGAADVWVGMPIAETSTFEAPAAQLVRIPGLTFPAFHPDLVYALRSDGSVFKGVTDYHSAIGLWAWRRGVAPADLSRLFTDEVQARLTYDRYWAPSAENLARDFAASDIPFAPFWHRVKRTGVFMHSVNHPRAATIALFAKSIARGLGASESVWDDPIEDFLDDRLAHIQWPVYPFVANTLGVRGSYRWRNGGDIYPDIASWAEATWATYGDTDPDSIRCDRLNGAVYDTVLEPALAVGAAR